MRKLKLFLAVFFLGVFILLAVENRALFGQDYAFDFNFFFFRYRTPQVIVGVYFLAIFLIGFLIAYFSSLTDQYRSRRTIRNLKKLLADRENGALGSKPDQKRDASDKAPLDTASGASPSGPSA